jgi:hypothetical protein
MSGTVFGGPDQIRLQKDVPDWDAQGPLLKQEITKAIDRVFDVANLDPSFKGSINSGIDWLVMYCEMARDRKRFANDPSGAVVNALRGFTLRTIG